MYFNGNFLKCDNGFTEFVKTFKTVQLNLLKFCNQSGRSSVNISVDFEDDKYIFWKKISSKITRSGLFKWATHQDCCIVCCYAQTRFITSGMLLCVLLCTNQIYYVRIVAMCVAMHKLDLLRQDCCYVCVACTNQT